MNNTMFISIREHIEHAYNMLVHFGMVKLDLAQTNKCEDFLIDYFDIYNFYESCINYDRESAQRQEQTTFSSGDALFNYIMNSAFIWRLEEEFKRSEDKRIPDHIRDNYWKKLDFIFYLVSIEKLKTKLGYDNELA